MIYFDSDMSKSTNTVVYFDWKTVIYIYACGKCLLYAYEGPQWLRLFNLCLPTQSLPITTKVCNFNSHLHKEPGWLNELGSWIT